jgi:hypothetical protein
MSKFTDVLNWQFKYKFYTGTITGRTKKVPTKSSIKAKVSSIDVGKNGKSKA